MTPKPFVPVLLCLAVSASAHREDQERLGYEVWITDQNNTAGYSITSPRGTHGGRLLIYEGEDLEHTRGPVSDRTVIDLADLFALGGQHNSTGANVVRPHMILVSPDHKYVALAFVASGHVAVLNTKTREPKALFRMSAGAGGSRQAHAAFWTADGRALIVANQNGKLLERINYDLETDTFTHDVGATLDLANCTTPNGHRCESATPLSDLDPAYYGPHNRPDNAPICPITSTNNKAYVSLRGGGMFVVDTESRPMAIVAEFGNQYFGRDGCGGVQSRNRMYLNSGAGSPSTNPSGYAIYQVKDNFPSAPLFLPANATRHLPKVVDMKNTPDRDAHGMVLTAGENYLWQFDRLANVAEVYRLPGGKHIRTVDLKDSGISSDPTPDLVALSPLGNRIYVTLRGPRPQTGAHASEGNSPGLGIVSLRNGGSHGVLERILPTHFRNPQDDGEESDPHGICIVLTER
jgi:DNA-binding beta-propeller fold protein YncE